MEHFRHSLDNSLMEEERQPFEDKEEWGEGEWLNEPGLFEIEQFEYK